MARTFPDAPDPAWGLSGFGYPSAPLPYALNVLSKILAFVTALTLFVPRRATASARLGVEAAAVGVAGGAGQ